MFNVIVVGALITTTVLRGLVFQRMWSWFVVPIFLFPELSLPVSIAYVLMASWLTAQYIEYHRSSTEPILSAVIESAITSIIVYIIGWALHACI